MRTNIDIDNQLLSKAMKLANTKTKKETVEVALAQLIKTLKRKDLLRFQGKISWEGNLDEMRSI